MEPAINQVPHTIFTEPSLAKAGDGLVVVGEGVGIEGKSVVLVPL